MVEPEVQEAETPDLHAWMQDQGEHLVSTALLLYTLLFDTGLDADP
jgi:hypothetical protein